METGDQPAPLTPDPWALTAVSERYRQRAVLFKAVLAAYLLWASSLLAGRCEEQERKRRLDQAGIRQGAGDARMDERCATPCLTALRLG